MRCDRVKIVSVFDRSPLVRRHKLENVLRRALLLDRSIVGILLIRESFGSFVVRNDEKKKKRRLNFFVRFDLNLYFLVASNLIPDCYRWEKLSGKYRNNFY